MSDFVKSWFVSKTKYTTWLSTIILVEKIDKEKVCVDYIDLNKENPKYVQPPVNMDKLADIHKLKLQPNSPGPTISGKRQFMSISINYFYNIMLVGLKNANLLTNGWCRTSSLEKIRNMFKVYINTMKEVDHTHILPKFSRFQRDLNPKY